MRAARGIRRVRVHCIEDPQAAQARVIAARSSERILSSAQARPVSRTQLGQARAEPFQRPRNRLVAEHRIEPRIHHRDVLNQHLVVHCIPATRQRILVPIQQVVVAHARLHRIHLEHAQSSIHHTRALPRAARRVERGQKRLAVVHAEHIVAAQRNHRKRIHVHRHRVSGVARAVAELQQIVVAARCQDLRTDQARLAVQQGTRSLAIHPRPAHA